MRRFAWVLAASSLGLASPAAATSLAEDLCGKASSDGVITAPALRSAVLTGAKVPFDVLDADGDGSVSTAEVIAALTTDASQFCAVGVPGRSAACTGDAITSLNNADAALHGFWNARGRTYDLVDSSTPRPSDRPWTPVVAGAAGAGRLVCRPHPAGSDGDAAGAAQFLLGKGVDSLTVERGPRDDADRLAKVEPAEIAFLNDRAANTRTASIDAVAGLQIPTSSTLSLIPFVQYSRSEVRDRTAGTDKTKGKFAIGAVATARFGNDVFDFAPLYARSLENHSELLGGRLTWRPGFLYRLKPFMNASHFGCAHLRNGACPSGEGLAAWADFRLIGSFGTVLDNGNDPKFVDGREYLRTGPSIALHVYGQSGAFRDFSVDVGFKHLFRLSGDGNDVEAFSSDVRWWVAGSQHVSLLYGYERARDEETLELTDKWRLGLGVRF